MIVDEATRPPQFAADPLGLALRLDPDRIKPQPTPAAISTALASMWPGSGDKLLVRCRPQAGVSTLLRWTAFWWAVRHPGGRLVIPTYSAGVAKLHNRGLAVLVERYGSLYGLDLDHRPGAKVRGEYGGAEFVGINAPLGGTAIDAVIVDSPFLNPDEARDPRRWRQLSDWWFNELSPRMSVGATLAAVLPVVHVDDAVACLGAVAAPTGRWNMLDLTGHPGRWAL